MVWPMASRWRLTFGSLGSAAPVPLQRSPLFRSHRLCLLFCFARGPPPAAGGLPPMAACPAPAAALSVCTGPRPRGRVLLLLFALAAAAPHPPSGLVGRSVGQPGSRLAHHHRHDGGGGGGVARPSVQSRPAGRPSSISSAPLKPRPFDAVLCRLVVRANCSRNSEHLRLPTREPRQWCGAPRTPPCSLSLSLCVFGRTRWFFLPRAVAVATHVHCTEKGRDRSPPAGRPAAAWLGAHTHAHSDGVSQLFIFLLALSDTDCAPPPLLPDRFAMIFFPPPAFRDL